MIRIILLLSTLGEFRFTPKGRTQLFELKVINTLPNLDKRNAIITTGYLFKKISNLAMKKLTLFSAHIITIDQYF